MIVAWSEQAAAQLQAIRDFLARTSPGYAQALAERQVVAVIHASRRLPRDPPG